jgi:hypothetical protein
VKFWPRRVDDDVTAATPVTHLSRAAGIPLSGLQTDHLSVDPGTGHTVAPGALPDPHAAPVMFVPVG